MNNQNNIIQDIDMNVSKKLLLIILISGMHTPTTNIYAMACIKRCMKKWTQRTLNNQLMQAIDHGDPAGVMAAIEQGANINLVRSEWFRYKVTPLINASKRRYAEIAQILLNAQVDPDIEGYFGKTALFYAADRGNTTIARLLLAAGADFTIKSGFNETASDCARTNHHTNICDAIIAEEAERNTLREQMAQEKSFNSPARHYLVKGPLSIEPLTHIFAAYATDPDLISDAEVRVRRAAQTLSKLHNQEYKEE